MAAETIVEAPGTVAGSQDVGSSDKAKMAQAGTVSARLLEEIQLWKRTPCPECGNNAMFYCCFCCRAAGIPESVKHPTARLPFGQCDVLFSDAPKKATGIHAKVLAPTQVRLVDMFTSDDHNNRTISRGGVSGEADCLPTVREVPKYDAATTFVLYPDDDSMTVSELRNLGKPLSDITLILIDSNWKKSLALRQSPGLAELRSVRLTKPPISQFWRYHDEGGECVSSIETLALVCSELDDSRPQDQRCQQQLSPEDEPLLFFFARQLAQIQRNCSQRNDGMMPTDPAAKRRRQEKVRQKDRTKKQVGVPTPAHEDDATVAASA